MDRWDGTGCVSSSAVHTVYCAFLCVVQFCQCEQICVPTGRACWSLGNAHSAMGNHEKALYFASKHLEISKEVCTSFCYVHVYFELRLAW